MHIAHITYSKYKFINKIYYYYYDVDVIVVILLLLFYNDGSAYAGTGMGTTYHLMVLEESWPTLSSPGHTEREKSTLTMMRTGQWATM